MALFPFLHPFTQTKHKFFSKLFSFCPSPLFYHTHFSYALYASSLVMPFLDILLFFFVSLYLSVLLKPFLSALPIVPTPCSSFPIIFLSPQNNPPPPVSLSLSPPLFLPFLLLVMLFLYVCGHFRPVTRPNNYLHVQAKDGPVSTPGLEGLLSKIEYKQYQMPNSHTTSSAPNIFCNINTLTLANIRTLEHTENFFLQLPFIIG